MGESQPASFWVREFERVVEGELKGGSEPVEDVKVDKRGEANWGLNIVRG